MIAFLKSVIAATEKHYAGYLTTIVAFFITSAALLTLVQIIGVTSAALFAEHFISLRDFVALNGMYIIIGFVIGFAFMSYIGGLFILASLNTKGTRTNAKLLNKQFINVLLLNVVLTLAGFIVLSPLFAIAFVQFANVEFAAITSLLLLLIFILLVFIVSVWAVLTPYLMLDKQLTLTETLRANWKLIRRNELLLAKRVLGMLGILLIYQIALGGLTAQAPELTLALSLFFIFFLTPFAITYFAETYRELRGK